MGVRRGAALRYGNNLLWSAALLVAQAGYALLAYLVAAGVLVGMGVLLGIGSHVWQNSLLAGLWSVFFCIPAIVFFIFRALDAERPRDTVCFMGMIFAAVAATAMPFVWKTALDTQALRDRGVIEKTIVIAEHSYTDSQGFTTYSYTLRSLDGPPIRRDLGTGYREQFKVGQRITVLTDPSGESAPSLRLQVSTTGPWLTARILSGFAAAALLPAPWVAPWPESLRRRSY